MFKLGVFELFSNIDFDLGEELRVPQAALVKATNFRVVCPILTTKNLRDSSR